MMVLTSAMGLLMCMTSVNAQMRHEQGQGQRQERAFGVQQEKSATAIPNLSDEQKSKIEALLIPHQKQMQALHNKMGELKARHLTLETAEKADMKAINANIDEITKVQNQLMKAKAEHQQQIRNLLTDEQKLWFDQKGNRHKGKKGDGTRSEYR